MFAVNAKIKGWILGILAAGFCALGLMFWQLPDGRMHVWFLNVGQGDSIFIRTPENHQILIDGGPGNKVIEELSEVMPFFDRSIDLVIATHPQQDHIGGLVEVLKRYDVENVLLNGVEYKNSYYDELLREIISQNTGIFVADAETDFTFGQVLVDVIYPFDQLLLEAFEEVNDTAIAVRIVYKDTIILLTADLEAEAEKQLVESGVNLKADIFKAGHHGSKTSSTLSLLGKVRPEITVIQSGEDNRYGHPHKEALERLKLAGVKTIRRNDLEGRIEFEF
ncbi:MBL fold metallo-hydrolase [Candidatus Peregrinibacteria bacterium]|nr:MBL fold metallo-hydrolase [Candidatus Peregrinibacteria bacterium]